MPFTDCDRSQFVKVTAIEELLYVSPKAGSSVNRPAPLDGNVCTFRYHVVVPPPCPLVSFIDMVKEQELVLIYDCMTHW